ncbi:MAG: TlpA disulfide reductase family protein [Fluviicola sp.]|nr:TlpA disulfide reductase family protein [Fluviicola sp.]
MKFITIGAFTLFISANALLAQSVSLKTGVYKAHLQLNQTTALPVRLTVEKQHKSTLLIIRNAEERIELKATKKVGDSLVFSFPNFDSELRVVATKKRHLKGYWINFNKANNYRIPFEAHLQSTIAEPVAALNDIGGKWEAYFSPKTPDQEMAVGLFNQTGNAVTGTFLTETGDYRFLEGVIEGSSFYVSCFDGSHAFLMTGSVDQQTIQGTFYSGKHFQTTWSASRNESFELSNPDSLTYLKENESQVKFTLQDLAGNNYIYPNSATENKVVIIQIMGTWCPNCMDETKYYKELYATYHSQGLEIISIGYEAAETFEEQAAKIKRLQERHKLDFTFLVGGKANKGKASQDFAMLNEVISFPTTIFIGRDGSVKRIHTGFNGPGTGKYYTEYVEKTNALIEALLAE